jgi:hypothetical protein
MPVKPRILLINPPIYDFSAYDFWLKPYGLLRAAGFLSGQAHFSLFDFLDRLDPRVPQQLGADFVVNGTDLTPFWHFLDLTPDDRSMPLWDLYPRLQPGVIKLADGCPFRCTYCSVPQVYPKFHPRPIDRSIAEQCRRWVDPEVNRLKQLAAGLNHRLDEPRRESRVEALRGLATG